MELKTARFTVLLDPAKKAAFEALCNSQDLTPSQVVRKLMRQYLEAHGVNFVPSGLTKAKANPVQSQVAAAKKKTPKK